MAREAALFVALMLVVQALLSGLSLGLSAAPLERDAAGILCVRDGGTATDQSQPGAPHHSGADCCTLGCSMVGALVPLLPADAATYPAPPRAMGAGVALAKAPPQSEQRSPQNPRAPPRLG